MGSAGLERSPLVSVVMIFLDEAPFLDEAIRSVFAQTHTDWELVLVDDGSTDGSTAIARRWAGAHPGRVRYLDHPDHENRGMSASRNRGVIAARGRYIAYLDGDDTWLRPKLERQLAQLAAHPESRLVYGPLLRWLSWRSDDDGPLLDDRYGVAGEGFVLQTDRVYQPPDLAALLLRHKDLVPSGALFERDLFLEVGGAEDEFRGSYEDAVVFLKMLLRSPAYVADRSWYRYRQRPDHGHPPAQSAANRLRFLSWAEAYLAEQAPTDPSLTKAIGSARRQVLHPVRSQLERRSRRLAAGVPKAGALLARHTRLAASRRLRAVPLAEVTDEFAFGLGPSSWNYYLALLGQAQQRPGWLLDESCFAWFFRHDVTRAVTDLNELLDLGAGDGDRRYRSLPRFWLGTYPWGGLLAQDLDGPGPAYGQAYDEQTGNDTSELWGLGRNLWYAPGDPMTLANEWRITRELHRSIDRHGYRPHRARGFPRVTTLRRGEQHRHVIVDGHHRLAVLAYRGDRITVVEQEAIVERNDVERWWHVRAGRCTAEEALAFFDAFFELNGSERWSRVRPRKEVPR
ncbi:MAG: glycosyltransferase family 2 protein [Acidimicrobiia bacterium]|nr:glycosyltransferase family 2 protein [Acidimicrobiia bacterium]MDH5288683.1 glycosyltransferase family 2 protein [Acidimicrobiia bacterium]